MLIMNRTQSYQSSGRLGGVIGFLLSLSLVYVVLLLPIDDCVSITNWIDWFNSTDGKLQGLIVALIPAYIALILFGGSALGWYFGSKIQSYFQRKAKKRAKNPSAL